VSAGSVEPAGRGLGRGRVDQRGGDEGHGAGRRAEPEGGVHAADLGDQPGQRVAQADARGDGHRQRRRGGPGPLTGERGARSGDRQRGQREPRPLQGAPGDQPPETERQRREHAAQQHDRQDDEDDGAPPPAVTEPADDRGGDGAHDQGHGQRPLGAGQRDVVGLGDGGDQRGAEAADDRDQHRQVQQDRHQPAARRGRAVGRGGHGVAR
jgi:hypothetical protein